MSNLLCTVVGLRGLLVVLRLDWLLVLAVGLLVGLAVVGGAVVV